MQEGFPTSRELKEIEGIDLVQVSSQIRRFLINSVSKTGGHIGANLGVIELTLALHYVFDSPKDKLIFDTGHTGYTHKILTGRAGLFPSLNKFGGMNRFLSRLESEHDQIDATHAGTSLSIAIGIAKAHQLSNKSDNVVAIIGDGSLVEGIAFEALNYIADSGLRIIIIVNDNGMAIAPNVGGIKNLTSGTNWEAKCKCFFEGLGIKYMSVPDGHDIPSLISSLKQAKIAKGPVLVHVKTEKGRGLPYAKDHPYRMHFSMPFNPVTGEGASPTISGRTYASVAADTLLQRLKVDEDLVIMTPATPYASSLDACMREFPDRVFDVGMAEQHAVTMACGLALGGKKPVICFQTTFMQRAFDQLIHDVAFMNLPVTILGVRSGFAGYDGPTHHGLYDIPYLRSFPNMQIMYPMDSNDLQDIISERLKSPVGPLVILYPYEQIPNPEPQIGMRDKTGFSLVHEGSDGIIYCIGNRLETAHQIRNTLRSTYGINFGIACISRIKPLPAKQIIESSKPRIVTLEEGTLPGGFGSAICELLEDNSMIVSVLRSGVKDIFVPAGSKKECGNICHIEPEQIVKRIQERWPELWRN